MFLRLEQGAEGYHACANLLASVERKFADFRKLHECTEDNLMIEL